MISIAKRQFAQIKTNARSLSSQEGYLHLLKEEINKYLLLQLMIKQTVTILPIFRRLSFTKTETENVILR